MSGQAETSNKQIKNILQKIVNQMAEAGGASLLKLYGHTERLMKRWSAYATLSASLREDLSPSHRTWTHGFLGHQKVEHEPQGG
jgi:hypothetical protein